MTTYSQPSSAPPSSTHRFSRRGFRVSAGAFTLSLLFGFVALHNISQVAPGSASKWASLLIWALGFWLLGVFAPTLTLLFVTKSDLLDMISPLRRHTQRGFVAAFGLVLLCAITASASGSTANPYLVGATVTALFVECYYTGRLALWYQRIATAGSTRRARLYTAVLLPLTAISAVVLVTGALALLAHTALH
jgi:hypothetical protein